MLKTLLVLTTLISSVSAFAAAPVNPYKEGLLNLKEAILAKDDAKALTLVDQLLALNPAPPAPVTPPAPSFKIFSGSAIQYYSGWIDVPNNNPQSCTWEDKQQAMRQAAQIADTACENANYRHCEVTGNIVAPDGKLDSKDLNRFNIATPSWEAVYTGCIATASVKGFN
ncbi:MAG: hypothetical protein ACXVB9_07970 [Bdellovibrionota bacterium]